MVVPFLFYLEQFTYLTALSQVFNLFACLLRIPFFFPLPFHDFKTQFVGSRLTNFIGILSQGLRIAPPEAPVTGYMVCSLIILYML
jgi:hypothetical protein